MINETTEKFLLSFKRTFASGFPGLLDETCGRASSQRCIYERLKGPIGVAGKQSPWASWLSRIQKKETCRMLNRKSKSTRRTFFSLGVCHFPISLFCVQWISAYKCTIH
eukprot:jgi/Botrbrau1/3906/Bobra.0183s0127.1